MGCAFTQKVVKLSKMLLSLGHETFIYGCEGSDAPCSEFIQTHTLKDIISEWGDGDNRYELGYNWKKEWFRHDFNKPRTKTTLKCFANSVTEINKRKKPDDFLLIPQGLYQKPVDDGVGLYLTCESGVGYRGSYAKFRAFESAFIQNFTYGGENPRECINGRHYDRVIPNYFDPKDFEISGEKDDYYFYLGRLIKRKGVEIAQMISKARGKKLLIAGQGVKSWNKGKLVGEDFSIEGDNIEYLGYLEPTERNRYLSRAKLSFVPTLYLEPFGGTNVEAQLSGTPVLTTNFGVFPETVIQGVTGFRCDTLQDFYEASFLAEKLKAKDVRKNAERFLMDNVKWLYKKWFEDLYQLYLSTTDKNIKGWSFIKEK
jgi:glycosyltransferase involved in cell wall biosynthesis